MAVLVAGSAHLDVLARPASESAHKDRRGRNILTIGGTGYNVACSLVRAGYQVRFLTAWNSDPFTKVIEEHLRSLGIEVMAEVDNTLPTASFVSMLTAGGDMEAAVSDMPVETFVFPDEKIDEALDCVEFVVLDANLKPSEMLRLSGLAKLADLKVFVLGVSEDKVQGILETKTNIAGAFVNNAECERLMKILRVSDHGDVATHLEAPLVVTRAELGAVVYMPDGSKVKLPPPELFDVENFVGVGDALAGAMIDGRMGYQMDWAEAAKFAHESVKRSASSESANVSSHGAVSKVLGSWRKYGKDKLTGMDMRDFMEMNYPRHVGGKNILLFIDCDHFKLVNDTKGHKEGDRVLQTVASILQATLRSTDLSCRWGGDEFVVVLPRTSVDEAALVADRMRMSVVDADLGVTLSIGLTETTVGETLLEALTRADDAMYLVKNGGKNAVSTVLSIV